MPCSSGLDLLRTLRERGVDVPFILLTAADTREVAAEAVSLDAQCLAKPIDGKALVDAVAQAVKARARPSLGRAASSP